MPEARLAVSRTSDPRRVAPALAALIECVRVNPVPVLALMVYMALRSTTIIPVETAIASENQPVLWAPAYPGWYDILLLASTCCGIFTGSIRVTAHVARLLFVLCLVVLVSLLSGHRLGTAYLLDALVYYARFACALIIGASLVTRLGTEAVESLVLALFVILAGTALLVYHLNFGAFNRIYAAAMTVASFGQIAAVSCFLSMLRRRTILLVLSAGFLLLTFSRTSILALAFLVLVYLLHHRVSLRARLAPVAGVATCMVLGSLALFHFAEGQFASVMTGSVDRDELMSMNGRLEVWSEASRLLEGGEIPPMGVGFNAAPSLLVASNFALRTADGSFTVPPHFHSIFIEYGFGLGLLSAVVFVGLGRRLVQTFSQRMYPAFAIFALFCITQTVDFSFYRPKEVVIWSFLLGIAEAQWSLRPGESTVRRRRGPDRLNVGAAGGSPAPIHRIRFARKRDLRGAHTR
jgi:hypothetical protein